MSAESRLSRQGYRRRLRYKPPHLRRILNIAYIKISISTSPETFILTGQNSSNRFLFSRWSQTPIVTRTVDIPHLIKSVISSRIWCKTPSACVLYVRKGLLEVQPLLGIQPRSHLWTSITSRFFVPKVSSSFSAVENQEPSSAQVPGKYMFEIFR